MTDPPQRFCSIHPWSVNVNVLLWELASNDGSSARCSHEHEPHACHIVSVTVGDAERFREEHPIEADAYDEAGHLLAHFLFNGGWTEVRFRDSRPPAF